MAGGAFARGRFEEKDTLAGHGSERFVAEGALDFLVGTLQREGRARFVIESGGLPVFGGMAGCAIGRSA